MSETRQHLRDVLSRSMNTPSEGRMYDYYLGGAANWAVDREFGDRQIAQYPDIPMIMRANRRFLRHGVEFLMRQGVRQFVDIGSGLPTNGNVHQVADRVDPGTARVVYVDHDPVAHAHAALLIEQEGDPARHAALNHDLLSSAELWADVLHTGLIDPRLPMAVLMVAVLHFTTPEQRPEEAVRFYRDRMPAGSYLMLSHGTAHGMADTAKQAKLRNVQDDYESSVTNPLISRSPEEIEAFFGGWPLLERGLAWTAEWSDGGGELTDEPDDPSHSRFLAGIARKPEG